MVATGPHKENVQQRLSEVEMLYTRAPSPTILELDPEDDSVESLNVPEPKQPSHQNEPVHEWREDQPQVRPETC